jgi:hypothetical protein
VRVDIVQPFGHPKASVQAFPVVHLPGQSDGLVQGVAGEQVCAVLVVEVHKVEQGVLVQASLGDGGLSKVEEAFQALVGLLEMTRRSMDQ